MNTHLMRPLKILMNHGRSSSLKQVDLLLNLSDIRLLVVARYGRAGEFQKKFYERFLGMLRETRKKDMFKGSITIEPRLSGITTVDCSEMDTLVTVAQLNQAWGGKVFYGTDLILQDDIWSNGGLGLKW
jgi:hypothetical protein